MISTSISSATYISSGCIKDKNRYTTEDIVKLERKLKLNSSYFYENNSVGNILARLFISMDYFTSRQLIAKSVRILFYTSFEELSLMVGEPEPFSTFVEWRLEIGK